MNNATKIALAMTLALASSGLHCLPKEDGSIVPGADASFEFHQIYFIPGRPRAEDSLSDAVVRGEDQLKKLSEIADLLRKLPDFQVEILGTTDNLECAGLACYDLSTRRARMIYDWLRKHGIPGESLYAFRGMATENPINANKDEEERQRSRRVEFGVVRASYGRNRSLIDNVGR